MRDIFRLPIDRSTATETLRSLSSSREFCFFSSTAFPRQHRISANFFPVSCPYKSWPKSVNFFLGPWRDLRLETWETTMERLYGSHNRARPSRIVCQPSDVILWINTPFDTKNFKRKYESLIKLHHFWRWYFLFFGEAVKNKLTDFGQLFCYPKFFKNKKKKIDRFRPTFLADRKKVGRNSVSPKKMSEEDF